MKLIRRPPFALAPFLAVLLFGCASGGDNLPNGPAATGGAGSGSGGTATGGAGLGSGGAGLGTGGAGLGTGGVAPSTSGGAFGVGGAPLGPGGSTAAGGRPGAGGSMIGSSGTGGGAAGTGGAIAIKGDPLIPPVAGDCPPLVNGTINFMGITGLQIAAGVTPESPTAPMLIYWHGTGSTADEYTRLAAPIAQAVIAAGGVIVSPQGTTGGDLLSGTSIFGAGDFKVMDQLVACAVKNNNVNPRRIYTAGCSAGGLMATAMAAERSSYIAAASPNSGGWVVPVPFDSMHTPPLMTVHGKMGSDVVVVDFSSTSATADKAFKDRGGYVVDCDTGGGHCGGSGLAGDAWKFFLSHPFGVEPEPYASGLPVGFSTECKPQ